MRTRSAAGAALILRHEPLEQRLMMSIAPWDPAASPPPVDPLAAQTVGQGNGPSFDAFASIRNLYGFTGAGQTVAVIDSGIAYTHSALGGGYGPNYRVVGGWDFAENDANPYDDGLAGAHGTHVSGIIGSADSHYTGAAPGVDLVALRVFDDNGNGSFDWIDQALRWVDQHRNDFAHPITAVNISIGTDWNSQTVPSWATLEADLAKLKADGIFIAVAAGNSFTKYNAPGLSYPAASSYVVPVASEDADGTISYFSQRDVRAIVAPGRNITSTVPDYLGNRNGRDDDFAAFSGTSMAAPYVAGASVLLRQALQFAGATSVNEDTLYNIMYNTADTVYDPATSRTYHELNIDRAIASVMPADDYGSTIATAANLGSLTTSAHVTGLLARRDDRDCFAFTAAQTGTLTISVSAADQVAGSWRLYSGAQQVASGAAGTITFQVVAGQTYTLDLGTSAGIGRYTVDLGLVAHSINWGTIGYADLANQTASPGSEFRFQAARDGLFSIEAFSGASGAVGFGVYDVTGQLVGSSTSLGASQRFDFTAVAGQTYVLRTTTSGTGLEFRLANLVTLSGDTARIYGTDGNDLLQFHAATSELVIGGVHYNLRGVRNFVFDGGAGIDIVQLSGTSAAEQATLSVGGASLVGAGFRFDAARVENVQIDSGGGADTATLYGSAGADTLRAQGNRVELAGAGYDNVALGFMTVIAYGAGGNDTASLSGSAGADYLLATPTQVILAMAGVFRIAQGFAHVQVDGGGGANQAVLSDSAGNDTLTARPGDVELSGTGYDNHVVGFQQVVVTSSGGTDRAFLYDSAGNDTLVANAGYTQLYGAGYDHRVYGFKQVRAYATTGNDQASLYAATGNNTLEARGSYARLTGASFDNFAFGFDRVAAYDARGTINRRQVAAVDFIFSQYGPAPQTNRLRSLSA
jgi:hypothetical protein